eukprot:gene7690-6416_t
MSAEVWVRLEEGEEGEELRVAVPAGGCVHDLLEAAVGALDFGRDGVRVCHVRAVADAGRK